MLDLDKTALCLPLGLRVSCWQRVWTEFGWTSWMLYESSHGAKLRQERKEEIGQGMCDLFISHVLEGSMRTWTWPSRSLWDHICAHKKNNLFNVLWFFLHIWTYGSMFRTQASICSLVVWAEISGSNLIQLHFFWLKFDQAQGNSYPRISRGSLAIFFGRVI